MERIVRFDGPKAKRRFEMVRVAMLRAGDGKGERSRERVRREARILDALDAISVIAAGSDVGRVLRELKARDDSEAPDEIVVRLEAADYKLVADYLGTTPWMPMSVQDAVDAQDWWETAKEVEK